MEEDSLDAYIWTVLYYLLIMMQIGTLYANLEALDYFQSLRFVIKCKFIGSVIFHNVGYVHMEI
jgi:hypothetical protein